MKSETLDLFISDINDVRGYINYINIVNKISSISTTSNEPENPVLIELREHLKSFRVSKKVFEYKSIIISLYGILEKHFSIWVKEFIGDLPKVINTYNDLPDQFQKDHFELSLKLLMFISEGRQSKYDSLDKEKILSRLNSCIEDPVEFQLNSEAFNLQTANLKHVKIAEALNYLDIKLTSSLKFIGMRPEGFLCDVLNVEHKSSDLFKLIDELVDLRNDIAHGVEIDSILGTTEFDKYIDFLEAYGKAIFQVLTEKTYNLEAEWLYEEILNEKGIFHDSTVLCFEIENNEVHVGDDIIVKYSSGSGYGKKQILTIEENDKSYDSLKVTEPRCIGIGVNGRISRGQTFYIKKY